MKSEKALQKYLMSQAAANGVYARKVAAIGRVGFPDVFLAFNGIVTLVELKNPNGKGRLSHMQEREIARLRDQGVAVAVIETKEQADAYIDALTYG